MGYLDLVIEARIKDAIKKGDFKDLEGFGKPLDLDHYSSMPAELRMAYSILKNANVVPEEVQLMKDIQELNEELKSCSNSLEKEKMKKTIRDKTVHLRILLGKQK